MWTFNPPKLSWFLNVTIISRQNLHPQITSKQKQSTLPETNISPWKGNFEDDFPFPKVGYVSFLEGMLFCWRILDFWTFQKSMFFCFFMFFFCTFRTFVGTMGFHEGCSHRVVFLLLCFIHFAMLWNRISQNTLLSSCKRAVVLMDFDKFVVHAKEYPPRN